MATVCCQWLFPPTGDADRFRVRHDATVTRPATVPPTWQQCRVAAESLCATEYGRTAVDTARGWAPFGLHRGRSPLTMMLYAAGLNGRLVWHSQHCFAVLDPPADERTFVSGGPRAQRMTRMDAWWGHAMHYGPVALIFFVLAPVVGVAVPRQYHPVAVALLAILVTVYLGAGAIPLLARYLRAFFRSFEGRTTVQEEFTSDLLGRHWSVLLCHVRDPGYAEPLLAETLGRVAVLDTRLPRAEDDDSLLLCREAAITSAVGRRGVADAVNATRLPGRRDGMFVVHEPGRYRTPDPVVVKPPAGSTMLLLATPLLPLLMAQPVAEAEAAACAETSCDGRPDSFREALWWLIGRAVLIGDLGDAAPVTTTANFFGLLGALTGVVWIALLVAASVRYTRYRRQAIAAGLKTYEATMTEAARAAFGGVFVNYRRGGHKFAVASIGHELGVRFGVDKVFLDIESMRAGARYPDELRSGLRAARVLVAIIHATWEADLRSNTPNLDWVQYEIEVALNTAKIVIPVLLDDAALPRWEDLPVPIREVVRRQARRLRWDSFGDDLRALVAEVERAAKLSG